MCKVFGNRRSDYRPAVFSERLGLNLGWAKQFCDKNSHLECRLILTVSFFLNMAMQEEIKADGEQRGSARGEERMKRLESGALAREARTIASMIELYCRAHHGTKSGLCPECEELNAYARKRLSCCPFGQDKSVCAKCKVHCYKPAMREKIGAVMRFAGPRIVFVHPLLSLEHLWKSLTVTPPEKPRAKPRTQTIRATPEAVSEEQKKN